MDMILGQCKYFLEKSGYQVITVVIVAILGMLIIRNLLKLCKQLLLASKLDNSLVGFALAIIKLLLVLALIFYCITLLGLSLTGATAVATAVTLAVGLAVQDLIGGMASGMMLISSRLFKVDDFVQIGSVAGVVKEINIMHTVLNTPDNKRVSLPNKTVYSSEITNYSSNPVRRLDMSFGVDYDSNVDQVKQIISDACHNHPLVLQVPAPMVRLANEGDSSLDFTARVWVNTPDYWTVNFDLQEEVFKSLSDAGINIPYPQVTLSYRSPVPEQAAVVEEKKA